MSGSGPIADLSQTFLLHSNPGADHTIYLDFDGHVTEQDVWTAYNDYEPIITPAYDTDGDPTSFADAELQAIQRILARVAAVFIPFDVDVTTEGPGADARMKSGSGDTQWGIRVVIGGCACDWYGQAAGGISYFNSFTFSTDTPVFIFEDNLAGQASIANAASHEVGHSLGLAHDGLSEPSTSYYQGHGSGETGWRPIMGARSRELTQWSNGDYPNASNTQDDLAIITSPSLYSNNGFGYGYSDYGSLG